MRKSIGVVLVLTLVASMTIGIATANPDMVTNSTNTDVSVHGKGLIISGKDLKTGEQIESTFKLNVQSKNNDIKGTISYHDGNLNIDVESTDIGRVVLFNTTYNVVGIAGTATINGSGNHPFYITVSDAGEPGKGNDYFRILLPSINTKDKNGSAYYVPPVPPWGPIPEPYEPDMVYNPPYSNSGYLESGNIQVKITNEVNINGGKGGIGGDVGY